MLSNLFEVSGPKATHRRKNVHWETEGHLELAARGTTTVESSVLNLKLALAGDVRYQAVAAAMPPRPLQTHELSSHWNNMDGMWYARYLSHLDVVMGRSNGWVKIRCCRRDRGNFWWSMLETLIWIKRAHYNIFGCRVFVQSGYLHPTEQN